MPDTVNASELGTSAVPVVRGSTRVVGVFGCPVEHSRSPAMHNAAFQRLGLAYIYVPFHVVPEALETALRSLNALNIIGVNLTIPHKERALPFLDEITDEAREVKAVNTVHCTNGRLIGDVTDGRGFYKPLQEQGFSAEGQRTVVLGAGGAARSIVFQLARAGAASIMIANRSIERARQLAQEVAAAGYTRCRVEAVALQPDKVLETAMRDADLLVQTTKVGMFPESEALPAIPFDGLHSSLLVYDLVYNPLETRLIVEAKRRGCRTLGGVKMLVYQGAYAFERWTGVWPPTDVMEQAVLEGLE